MAIWCVAVWKSKLNGPVLGYYICESSKLNKREEIVNGQKVEYDAAARQLVTKEKMIKYFHNPKFHICNMELSDGEPKFNSGTAESYAVLDQSDNLLGVGSKPASNFLVNGRYKHPFIVIGHFEDADGVECLLPSGRLCRFPAAAVINDVENKGRVLSNAYITTNNGNKIIRSKNGELDRKNLTDNKPIVPTVSTPTQVAQSQQPQGSASYADLARQQMERAKRMLAEQEAKKKEQEARERAEREARELAERKEAEKIAEEQRLAAEKARLEAEERARKEAEEKERLAAQTQNLTPKNVQPTVVMPNSAVQTPAPTTPPVQEEPKQESSDLFGDLPDADENKEETTDSSGSLFGDLPDAEESTETQSSGGSDLFGDLPDADESDTEPPKTDNSLLSDIPEAEEKKEEPAKEEEQPKPIKLSAREQRINNIYKGGVWTEKDTNEFMEFETFGNFEMISRIKLERMDLVAKAFGDGKWNIPFPVMHNGRAVRIIDSFAIGCRFNEQASESDPDYDVREFSYMLVDTFKEDDCRIEWVGKAAMGIRSIITDPVGQKGFRVVDSKGMWVTRVVDDKKGVIGATLPATFEYESKKMPYVSYMRYVLTPSVTSDNRVVTTLVEVNLAQAFYRQVVFKATENILEFRPECMRNSAERKYGNQNSVRIMSSLDLSSCHATFIPKEFIPKQEDAGRVQWVMLNKYIIRIHEAAFDSLKGKINIPKSVTEIARRAFADCKFDKIYFEPGVCFKAQGKAFFGGETNQKNIDLSMSGAGISNDVFNFCKYGSVESIKVPGSVKELGPNAVCVLKAGSHEYCNFGAGGKLILEEGIESISKLKYYCFKEIHVADSVENISFAPLQPMLTNVVHHTKRYSNSSNEPRFNVKVYLSRKAKSLQAWRSLISEIEEQRSKDLKQNNRETKHYGTIELVYVGAEASGVDIRMDSLLDNYSKDKVAEMYSSGKENEVPYKMSELLAR